jgi:hypothetical protein
LPWIMLKLTWALLILSFTIQTVLVQELLRAIGTGIVDLVDNFMKKIGEEGFWKTIGQTIAQLLMTAVELAFGRLLYIIAPDMWGEAFKEWSWLGGRRAAGGPATAWRPEKTFEPTAFAPPSPPQIFKFDLTVDLDGRKVAHGLEEVAVIESQREGAVAMRSVATQGTGM